MDSSGGFHHLSIEADPKFSHCFHLIAGGIAEQFRGEVPQFLLHSNHDRARLLQLSRNVEQAEEESLSIAAGEVIKIAAAPLSVVDRSQFTIPDLRNLGVDRILPGQQRVRIGSLLHGQHDELSTDFEPSQ